MRFRARPRHIPVDPRSGNAATLVAVVLLLTVGGIMIGVNMAGDQGSDYNEKVKETQRRINFLHERIRVKMAEAGRLPRPANGMYRVPDPTKPEEDTNYFGVEGVPSSDLDPSSLPKVPIGPDVATGKVLRGDVPLVTLNIDDPKYMFDAWGNRLVYEVQEDATEEADCRNLQDEAARDPLNALVDVRDYSGSTKERVFYAIVSLGMDGHLAVPMEGSTVANRRKVGNTDADTLTNGVPNPSQFRNVLIQKSRTSTFDDIVSFAPSYKRTCCLKPSCMATSDPQPGFKYVAKDAGDLVGFDLATGDVNSDNIPDLIIGSPYEKTVYVVFGNLTGFPSPLPLASLDGTNGFRITNPGGDLFGWSVHAGGDVNGDGIADIAIVNPKPLTAQLACPAPTANKAYVVFGRTTWPANVQFTNIGGNWGPTGSAGFAFGAPGKPPNFGYDVMLEKVKGGSGIASFCVSSLADVSCTYGHAGGFPVNPSYVDASTLVGASNGFVVVPDANDGSDPDRPVSPTGTQNFAMSMAAGDINNDGLRDLILGAPQVTPPAPNDNAHAGAVYVVFGRSLWEDEIEVANLTGSNGFRLDGIVTGSKLGSSVAAGDVNGDGVADIIAGAAHAMLKLTYNSTGTVFCCTTQPGKVYVMYGNSGPWPEYYNLGGLNGANGFLISGTALNDNFGMSLAVGDINGDSFMDIIASAPTEGGSGEGATYVVYGKSVFLSGMDVTSPDGVNVARAYGSLPFQYSGWAVAAGNLNGADGSDIAIATPFSDFGAGADSGGGYIIFGPLGGANVDLENM